MDTPVSSQQCRYYERCGNLTNAVDGICDECRRKRLLPPAPSLQDELDQIKRTLEQMKTSPQENKPERGELISAIEMRINAIEAILDITKIYLPATEVVLVDADKVDRLGEDEKVAGVLLGFMTLFLGALLEQWLSLSTNWAPVLFASIVFGCLALYFYWRAHNQQLALQKGQKRVSLSDWFRKPEEPSR